MQDLMSQIKELKKKANMYENVRGRYVEHAKKMQQAISILTDVMKEMDPVITMRERSGLNYKEILGELFDKLKRGASIGTDLIQNAYDLNKNQTMHVYMMLSKMRGVEKRKQGKKAFLYIQKEG